MFGIERRFSAPTTDGLELPIYCPYLQKINILVADFPKPEGRMQTSQPAHQPTSDQRARLELERRTEEKRLAKLKAILQQKLQAAQASDHTRSV